MSRDGPRTPCSECFNGVHALEKEEEITENRFKLQVFRCTNCGDACGNCFVKYEEEWHYMGEFFWNRPMILQLLQIPFWCHETANSYRQRIHYGDVPSKKMLDKGFDKIVLNLNPPTTAAKKHHSVVSQTPTSKRISSNRVHFSFSSSPNPKRNQSIRFDWTAVAEAPAIPTRWP